MLSIGLTGLPTVSDIGIALVLVMLVPLKVALYFAILTRFKLRARTATMTSLGLANYSEFGLIVASFGVAFGMLEGYWLVALAKMVALSFLLASPINAFAEKILKRLAPLGDHLTVALMI